jgi:carbon monoxide dehydrogenase subunit G
MVNFDETISIDRSLQDVFEYISDPANETEWRDAELAEWTSEGPHGVGSTQRSVSKLLGRSLDTIVEVVAWDPPNRAAFKSVGGPFPFEYSVTLEPEGEGTRLSMQGQGDVGGFFKLAEGLIAGRMQKQFSKDFKTLKSVLESR